MSDKAENYATSYTLNGHYYASNVVATQETILDVLSQRGLGETVEGVGFAGPEQQRPSYWLWKCHRWRSLERRGLYVQNAVHSSVWAGFIASNAGVLDASEMLSDEGLIHEAVHLLGMHRCEDGWMDTFRGHAKSLALRWEAIEPEIPGFHA